MASYTPLQVPTAESQPVECARVELIENLQRKMSELKERYAEAEKRLELDIWPVNEPMPPSTLETRVMLEETTIRLTFLKAYYLFTCVARKIEAGWTIPDDEWMKLREKLGEVSEEIHLREGRWPSYYFAERVEKMVYKLLPLASATFRQIVNEINEIKRVLNELEEEMRQQELSKKAREEIQQQELSE